LVWAEGEAIRKLVTQGVTAVDRYHLAPAAYLAIWTTPSGSRELLAALELVHPKSVYLFGVDPVDNNPEAFLNRLAGLIKYSLKTKHEDVRISALAAATGQREALVQKGLDWMAACGHISVEGAEGDEIRVRLAAGSGLRGSAGASQPDFEQVKRLEAEIKSLWVETAAFRAYFSRADKNDLINPSV
jgi:hypothetical protein